jgi:hypothetical protein
LHLSPDGKVSALYDQAHQCWSILDMNTRCALVWLADAGRLPAWESAAPFKQILQWSMVDTHLSMLHAGAVTDSRHGVLLAGPGGSGKSTTVAACLQAGLRVCGDDLLVVSRSRRGWFAHALYDAIKLFPEAAIPAPSLLAQAPWRACGDKRLIRYSDAAAGALAPSTPLRALLQCQVTGRVGSRLIPVAPQEMLKAIAPSTVFMLRGREAHLLKEAGALVRSLPCMRLELGADPAGAAALLRRWLGDYSGGVGDA